MHPDGRVDRRLTRAFNIKNVGFEFIDVNDNQVSTATRFRIWYLDDHCRCRRQVKLTPSSLRATVRLLRIENAVQLEMLLTLAETLE